MSVMKKVMIVDDDIDVLEQVAAALESDGYEVVLAEGLADAERQLEFVKPDVAVVDLMMEELDSGFVLCNEIKELYPGTPIIILTGVTAATGLDFPAPENGGRPWIKADGLIHKPVRPEQLKGEVRRLLRA